MFLQKRTCLNSVSLEKLNILRTLMRKASTRQVVLPAAFIRETSFLSSRTSNTGALDNFRQPKNPQAVFLGKHLSTDAGNNNLSSQEIVYKFRWIKNIRFISRVKMLHVLIVSGLTGPMCVWYSQGTIPFSVFLASVIAATATTGGLFALSYFFRRIVGVFSLDRNENNVTISSLTFWGNRKNVTLPVTDLVPMSESGFDPKHLFHRLELYGTDFVYLLNLRHGEAKDTDKLLGVLGLLPTSNK